MEFTDESYMRTALEMARVTIGQTGTNPSVGCVIVKNGRIIGFGAHLRQGEAHAEVHALQMAGPGSEGSTVYVTLEPCSHCGRTPPCADSLVRAKVGRVVIACPDPNPLVGGEGISRLRENGIEVSVGVLEREAREMNEVFFHTIRAGRPFVAVKTASTLDGKLAARTGDSRWITNGQSRSYVQGLRHRYGAIMIGAGTVLADDPRLTARQSVPSRDPLRVIIDSQLRTPPTAAALQPRSDGLPPALICTTAGAPAAARAALAARGAEIADCGAGPRVDLSLALQELSKRSIASVLVEGGGQLSGAFLSAGLADKVYAFIAPKIIGEGGPNCFSFPGFNRMADAVTLERVSFQAFGDNMLITGYPAYEQGGEIS